MRLGNSQRSAAGVHHRLRNPHRSGWLAVLAALLAAQAVGCSGGLLTVLDGGPLSDAGLVKADVVARGELLGTFTLAVPGGDEYQRVDLGPSRAGDHWSLIVDADRSLKRRLVLALFEADDTLLLRARASELPFIEHTLRRDTDGLWIGLACSAAPSEEVVELTAVRETGRSIPAARPQVVWLNFAGASDVRINDREPISLGPFDAADLGPRYDGQAKWFESRITAIVRSHFADYSVVILTSYEQSEPDAAHSTVHFGGSDDEYLGIGDGVDRYNRNPSDSAIVFTRAFNAYDSMNLSPEEMARMVGNTAAHELAHLLGLFHTRGSRSLMDDTRTAWELCGESEFRRGPLAGTVFPAGVENCPRMLEESVGLSPL